MKLRWIVLISSILLAILGKPIVTILIVAVLLKQMLMFLIDVDFSC